MDINTFKRVLIKHKKRVHFHLVTEHVLSERRSSTGQLCVTTGARVLRLSARASPCRRCPVRVLDIHACRDDTEGLRGLLVADPPKLHVKKNNTQLIYNISYANNLQKCKMKCF